jgi:hypothetical protein
MTVIDRVRTGPGRRSAIQSNSTGPRPRGCTCEWRPESCELDPLVPLFDLLYKESLRVCTSFNSASEMDTLAKSAESAIVNAYNAGDKKGTFAVKVKRLCCERFQQFQNPEFGHPSVRLGMHRC